MHLHSHFHIKQPQMVDRHKKVKSLLSDWHEAWSFMKERAKSRMGESINRRIEVSIKMTARFGGQGAPVSDGKNWRPRKAGKNGRPGSAGEELDGKSWPVAGRQQVMRDVEKKKGIKKGRFRSARGPKSWSFCCALTEIWRRTRMPYDVNGQMTENRMGR